MPTASGAAADRERIILLECRLEQLRSALDGARADADGVRVKLAEAAAREADHARRHGLIQQELAEARAEIASLHERFDRSEALRAELQGYLFEAGARGDAAELVRLRREVLAQRQRSIITERTCTRLRARVDELLSSRETLLTRVAEWQRLVQKEGPGAADLAEFMAELRGDILHLEQRNAAGERQEAALRDRLVRAGLDPDEPAAEHVPAALLEALEGHAIPELLPLDEVLDAAARADDDPPAARTTAAPGAATPEAATTTAAMALDENAEAEEEAAAEEQPAAEPTEVTLAAGTEPAHPVTTDADASVRPTDAAVPPAAVPPAAVRAEPTAGAAVPPVEGLDAADPSARAAAYERLTRVLDSDPTRLAYHLRPGLADPHPRVRRRAVLAAATAQRLPLERLLEPLQADPDPHVRRVVREVLRHASRSRTQPRTEVEDHAVPASAPVLSENPS